MENHPDLLWRKLLALIFLYIMLMLPCGQALHSLKNDSNVKDRSFSKAQMKMDPNDLSCRASRRNLYDQNHPSISYGALKSDNVPCGITGQSYYYCNHADDQANPYTRACTSITRCHRDMN
ncbi:hypothetical protein SUGI_0565000 [Cryptomeria japonica]|nr:hypothetical protein SUGI_0565000 [Cryptomeria japonica]